MNPATLSKATRRLMKLGGVWVPSPLALDENGRMLEKWQRLLTLYYLRSGARTVIPGTHCGEFAGGDVELFARWLRIVREMVEESEKEAFLMASVSGSDPVRQAERAAEEGYDLVMLAPTAYTEKDDDGVVRLFREVASIIPVFGFELQQAIPGSRPHSLRLWQRIFEIAWGAKGASFNTYRAQVMLEAAARSSRRDELVVATGNDDRIVYDLGGLFPFSTADGPVTVRYSAGLLGHFATDTRAAVEWSGHVRAHRDGGQWELPVSKPELAHLVNMCNGALFDALNQFENSVWGVKCRLTALGLLPGPHCLHETGREEMPGQIEKAYAAHPCLSDVDFMEESLAQMKREVGLT